MACMRVHGRVFQFEPIDGNRLATAPSGAHVTKRSLRSLQRPQPPGLVWRLCALGLLLLFNAVAPQAGIVALASCLAHLPGAESEPIL